MPEEKKTILAIDDEPEFLSALRATLEGAGYAVETSSSPLAGLQTARERHFDLILLDVSMPDLDGYQLCEKLKIERATFDVPVLFLSARAEPVDMLKGFFSGAHDFLPKPVRQADLLRKIAKLIP